MLRLGEERTERGERIVQVVHNRATLGWPWRDSIGMANERPATLRLAMDASDIGSLAVPSPQYRETMETGEGAAVLLALRRGSAHLFYPGTDRGYWVPTRQVKTIPPEAVPDKSLETLFSHLLRFLRAEECVVLEFDGRSTTLEITYPGMERAKLLELLEFLGDMLADYAIRPGSMQVALLQLDLVNLPDPAPAP